MRTGTSRAAAVVAALATTAIVAAAGAAAASAAETITYGYDARGRLVRVVRTGSVNSGVTTTYTHDRAHNRRAKIVTGSTNPPPP